MAYQEPETVWLYEFQSAPGHFMRAAKKRFERGGEMITIEIGKKWNGANGPRFFPIAEEKFGSLLGEISHAYNEFRRYTSGQNKLQERVTKDNSKEPSKLAGGIDWNNDEIPW